jgi:DNA adenine methylase
MVYACDNCKKEFQQKSHFDSHKARKRPCKPQPSIEQLVEEKVKQILQTQTAEPLPKISIVKPFLKWVGGKTQILDEVFQCFPRTMQNYHEPFLGGGSVLLALLSYKKNGSIQVTGKIYASDLNSNLIGLYKNIQKQHEELIAKVKEITNQYEKCKGTEVNRKPTTLEQAMTSPESYYYWIRSRFNALSKEQRMSVDGSAMMLFMNKTCFRGVYREGPNGFNVPFGNYKNPGILEEAHLREVSTLINDVEFNVAAFTDSLAKVSSGDFVYLDPPYAPETDTSFVSYTSDGFTADNHKALFQLCSDMEKKGVKFLMSNAEVKLVRDSFPFPKYTTKIISCRRAIHSKKPETKTNEVLIRN